MICGLPWWPDTKLNVGKSVIGLRQESKVNPFIVSAIAYTKRKMVATEVVEVA